MASPVVDVYVKLPSGRTSVLNLLPTDRVKKINDKIGNEEGIPTERVRMKYQGKILKKSDTIGYLGIRPETILKADIVIPKEIKVYVKITGGCSVPIDVQTTDSLNDLKCAVERLEIVSPEKVKCFKISGRTLHPDNTPLFELSIVDECVLEVILRGEATSEPENTSNIEVTTVDEDLKDAVMSSFQTNGKAVEVVFSFDTTGSMAQYIQKVRTKLRETCQRLVGDIPNIRIGLIAHGDYCDYNNNYVIKIQDLTSDIDQLVDFAEKTPSTSGGDIPECYEWVLHKAQQLDWSEDSAKALIVIGDSEPHPPSYTDQNISWHTELDILKAMDVKVYGVFCNRNTSLAEHFYQELADRTGGYHLKLANFSLITEMFIGVCYKESNQDQLDNFTEELKKEGKFTEETEVLMKQLEETKPKIEDRSCSTEADYLKKHDFPWWNFKKCNKEVQPEYKYDTEKDLWSKYNQGCSYKPPTTLHSSTVSTSSDKDSPISSTYISKHLKQHKKKGCSIM